ncbi:MAG: hypothetical protein FJW37_07295, partial [Acidobacteria bacterium]|nr:hypothetical protein [Acidobacteriota bacterium]
MNTNRKAIWICGFAAALALAETAPHPTGNRTTPPTINTVAPLGAARGSTVEMDIEGLNLAGARAIHFSEPGIRARILRIKELPDLPDVRLGANGTPSTVDLGPLPPRNQVTVELEIDPEAHAGPVDFRVETPLGTSPEGRFLIEPYYGEAPDREPNDTPAEAFETFLPAILVGTIARPGDVDHYRIQVKAGDEIAFDNSGQALGSALQPVVRILDAANSLVREAGYSGGAEAVRFAYRFEKAGAYYIRVSDYQESGSGRHLYRIRTGKFPLALTAYPLGVEKGKTAEIALKGHNLPQATLLVKGEASPSDERAVILRQAGEIRLALGSEPEIEASGKNTSIESAQALAQPVIANGKLARPEHYFRFRAARGEKLMIEVEASRLGSPLDSFLEVLDASGKPIERATVRCLFETSTTLSERDSIQPAIRIFSPVGFAVGDYMMIGGEIVQIEAMPRTPDDDFRFVAINGQRAPFFDTSTEAHAADKPAYKVEIHPPGARFASNGLPVVRLYYRNDDGGPGFAKDSRLRFTAPAQGEYIVRLRDVRGLSGEDFTYRLSVRGARPDFQLSVAPKNPNVPLGGRIPLTVTASRMDEFEGPIEVRVEGLPAGVRATGATIGAGQVSTTLLLSADASAAVSGAAPLKVVGEARIGGRLVSHTADPGDHLKLIAVAPRPDIVMTAETREVALEPGGTAEVWVAIERHNNYG